MAASWNTLALSYLMRHSRTHRMYFIPAVGTPIAMDGDYGSPEFLAQHQRLSLARETKRAQEASRDQAIEAERRAHPPEGYISQLLGEWQTTTGYLRAAAMTRKARESHVASIEAAFGGLSRAALEQTDRREFYRWREQFEDRPETARKYQQTLIVFLNWAVENSRLSFNPVSKMKRVAVSDQSREDIIWEANEEEAFLAIAAPGVRDLFLALLYTGARVGDVCGFTLGMLSRPNPGELWLDFKPSKTMRSPKPIKVSLPIHELPPLYALVTRLEETAKALGSRHLLVPSKRGGQWKAHYVTGCFARTKKRAGISRDLRANDLRGTCANRLSDAGATEDNIRAVLGKRLPGTIGYYLKVRKGSRQAYTHWATAMAPAPASAPPPASSAADATAKVISFRKKVV